MWEEKGSCFFEVAVHKPIIDKSFSRQLHSLNWLLVHLSRYWQWVAWYMGWMWSQQILPCHRCQGAAMCLYIRDYSKHPWNCSATYDGHCYGGLQYKLSTNIILCIWESNHWCNITLYWATLLSGAHMVLFQLWTHVSVYLVSFWWSIKSLLLLLFNCTV